uniref:Uncharacterized protein n=1 Tax=Echinococcus granulosus TaxID=6210 RepID=A0A068WU55_ECHGR|nr:hypothetical protein EgrG_002038800 [Echinococcus granulosus]
MQNYLKDDITHTWSVLHNMMLRVNSIIWLQSFLKHKHAFVVDEGGSLHELEFASTTLVLFFSSPSSFFPPPPPPPSPPTPPLPPSSYTSLNALQPPSPSSFLHLHLSFLRFLLYLHLYLLLHVYIHQTLSILFLVLTSILLCLKT